MGNQTEEIAWNQLIKGFQYYAKEAWISFCNCGHNRNSSEEKIILAEMIWANWRRWRLVEETLIQVAIEFGKLS